MGRYAERAEASLRLLRTVFMLLNGEEPIGPNARRILLQTVSQVTATLPGFMKASAELLADPEDELLQIIKDGNRLGSIKSTLNSMLASADESKELLSTDTIRVINDIRDALGDLDLALTDSTSAPEEALDPLVTVLAALSGLMQESMIRSVGWRFMELGKRIERSLQAVQTIRSLLTPITGEGDQSTPLTALLITMDVLITYRRRSRERRGIGLGLELVLLDENNPRSVIFQLQRLQQHLSVLPKVNTVSQELEEEERALMEAITSLKLSRLPDLLEDNGAQREALNNLLVQLDRLLKDFNGFISDKHFDHRTDTQQLVTTFWGAR
ncbi:alpha-E domain-containing protein [Oceanicoccus sp. KOV_DT_Chl]|uniref:alpha-E domain-containing protein n=1 Tax=Oceanicoccus sp. KOV_DT_Chl TaxID=1904639 RepID=UPI001F216FC8|nr:alpha-E domain-containing protein [Oceanicoccus sp. KOV_DT_Chl]